jgi:hypothetical protein
VRESFQLTSIFLFLNVRTLFILSFPPWRYLLLVFVHIFHIAILCLYVRLYLRMSVPVALCLSVCLSVKRSVNSAAEEFTLELGAK